MSTESFTAKRDPQTRRLAVRCHCRQCGTSLTAAQGLVTFCELPAEPIALSFVCRRCDGASIAGQGTPAETVRTLAWFLTALAHGSGISIADIKAEFDRIKASNEH